MGILRRLGKMPRLKVKECTLFLLLFDIAGHADLTHIIATIPVKNKDRMVSISDSISDFYDIPTIELKSRLDQKGASSFITGKAGEEEREELARRYLLSVN